MSNLRFSLVVDAEMQRRNGKCVATKSKTKIRCSLIERISFIEQIIVQRCSIVKFLQL